NEIRFRDNDNSAYVGFKAPATVNTSVTYNLPDEDSAAAGYVLSTDASGNLSWIVQGAPADNLGNGIATNNIQLNDNWLSNDGGNEGIRVTDGGNVGIGTSTPDSELHVDGASNATLILEADGVNDSRVWFADGFSNNPGVIEYDHNLNKMILGTTDGSADLTIDGTGQVGVGSNSPRSLFEVAGDIQIGNSSATCDATKAGAMRYTGGNVEYCNGTAWQAFGTAAGGEVNTASNQGIGGVGVFSAKNGVDLEFKNINNASEGIVVADDAGNDEIDISLDIPGVTDLGAVADNADSFLVYDASGTALREVTRAQVVLTEAEVDAYANNNGYGDILDGGNTNGADVTIGTNDGFDLNFETNGSNVMTIFDDGNIGIGTTTVSQYGVGRVTSIYRNTGDAELNLNAAGGSSTFQSILSFSNNGTPTAHITGGKSANGAGDGRLLFGTHNGTSMSNRMTIDQNGDVGIGTTAPDTKLHVFGDARFQDAYVNLDIKDNNSTGIDDTGGSLNIKDSSDNLAFLLGIPGSVGNAVMTNYNANGAIKFQTAGTNERMIIDKDGNVGVGTTSPARLLQVEGPMRITASTAPSSPVAGDMYVDSGDSNKLKYYDGSAWIDTSGPSGSSSPIFYSCANTQSADSGNAPCFGAASNGGKGNSSFRAMSCENSAGTGLASGTLLRWTGSLWQFYHTNDTWYNCTDGTVVVLNRLATGGVYTTQWSDAVGGINYASGNVGIGTTNPVVELDVDTGTINAASICDETNSNCLDLSSGIGGSGYSAGDTILVADGSVSAPSLAFNNDTNTGIYRSAADRFNIAVGGVNSVEVRSDRMTYSSTFGSLYIAD
ncbi:MAG: hypothetical protein HRT44_08905, partial [Bdellovibrionales bacterium]|nr:hypothetical protein [Bdellovibrionales bacterium]